MINETLTEEDPREANLKYVDVATKEMKLIVLGYAQTQNSNMTNIL